MPVWPSSTTVLAAPHIGYVTHALHQTFYGNSVRNSVRNSVEWLDQWERPIA